MMHLLAALLGRDSFHPDGFYLMTMSVDLKPG